MFTRSVSKKVRAVKWVLDARIFFSISASSKHSVMRYLFKFSRFSLSSAGLLRRVGLIKLVSAGLIAIRNCTGFITPMSKNSLLSKRVVKRRSYLTASAKKKCLKTGIARGLRFGTSRLRLLRNSFKGIEPSPSLVRW